MKNVMNNVRMFLRGSRPVTLVLSLCPVLICVLCSSMDMTVLHTQVRHISPFYAISLILVALNLQIASNFANDFIDGRWGRDKNRSSFAPSRLNKTHEGMIFARNCAIMTSVIAIIAGLSVVIVSQQYWLCIVGCVCLIVAWGYSAVFSAWGIGEILAFIFFGPVVVWSGEILLIGALGPWAILSAMQCGLICALVLLINNVRDVLSDSSHGKKTLVVRWGKSVGIMILATALFALIFMNLSQNIGALSGVNFHISAGIVVMMSLIFLMSVVVAGFCLYCVKRADRQLRAYKGAFISMNVCMFFLLLHYCVLFLVVNAN